MAQVWRDFCNNLEELTNRKPLIERLSLDIGPGLAVQFPGSPLELELVAPEQADCLVAEKLVPGKPEVTLKVLDEVTRLGSRLGSGSVLVDESGVPDRIWEESEYQRQYYFPLSHEVVAGKGDLDGLIQNGVFREFRSLMERALKLPVDLEYYMDERPYVLSLDYHGPSEGDEKPPFHLYIHFYELTGTLYIEKVEIPAELRGNGYGSQFVDYMKWFSTKYNLAYMYLEAKTTAEVFWERHGFEYLYRYNLRKQARTDRAMRRRPGWQRGWVGEYRLQQPYWQYKNHPQDDLDLTGGLLVHDKAWNQLQNIAS